MKRSTFILSIAAILILILAVGIVSAAPVKVDVCHYDGNGIAHLINISENAFETHVAHGDASPGDAVGAPYGGLYGSTVTPVLSSDCNSVLRIDTTQSFASGGWAGWSCVEPGHPFVVGGGVVPATGGVIDQGPAKYGAAPVDGYNYPVYPHYTYNGGSNTPGGEEGWVVRAGSPVPTGIFVLCAAS